MIPHPRGKQAVYIIDLTFIRQKGNVIFLGPPGGGKTHLAVSLALKACQTSLSIYFTTMEDLIGKLKKIMVPNGKAEAGAITNRRW